MRLVVLGVDDDDVVPADAAERHVVRGVGVGRPVERAARLVERRVPREERERVGRSPPAPSDPNGSPRWNGSSNAAHFRCWIEDLDVVRIDARLFDRRAEQELRLAREVLVERRARRDEHADALGAAPPGAAEALPRGRDRARVARAHDRVELADVDPELERVRRHDAEDLAFAQPPLDVAPLLGKVAAAVGHDARWVDPAPLSVRRERVAAASRR